MRSLQKLISLGIISILFGIGCSAKTIRINNPELNQVYLNKGAFSLRIEGKYGNEEILCYSPNITDVSSLVKLSNTEILLQKANFDYLDLKGKFNKNVFIYDMIKPPFGKAINLK